MGQRGVEMPAGYAFIEHTADIGIRAWGDSIEESFEQAGWALAELLGARVTGPGERRSVEAAGGDAEAVLVDFLNELLLLHELEGAGFAAIRVRHATEERVDAEVEITRLSSPPEGTQVKAATLHQLNVERLPDGRVEARVYLDV